MDRFRKELAAIMGPRPVQPEDDKPEEKDTKASSRHVPVGESVENIMAALINRIIVNEAIQNRQQ
jgi:hypothetical protein